MSDAVIAPGTRSSGTAGVSADYQYGSLVHIITERT